MTKYANGANLERQIKQELESRGWYVIRSAGSKGIADLVSIRQGRILIIQVKKNSLSERSKLKLISGLLKRLPNNYYYLEPKVLSGGLKAIKEEIRGW